MSSWLIRVPSLRRNNCLAPENSSTTAAKPSESVPVILSDDQEQSGGGVDPQALDIGPKAATMHYLIDQAIRCYGRLGAKEFFGVFLC